MTTYSISDVYFMFSKQKAVTVEISKSIDEQLDSKPEDFINLTHFKESMNLCQFTLNLTDHIFGFYVVPLISNLCSASVYMHADNVIKTINNSQHNTQLCYLS